MQPNIPEDIDDLFEEAGKRIDEFRASQAARDLRQQRFEETAVRRLLAHFGLSGLAASLKRRCQEVTGQDKLLFETFYAQHPSFPVRLYFKKIPFMHKVTQVDLFKRFSSLAFFKAFVEVHEQDDAGKPVGLVFDWPTPEVSEKVQGLGLMVAHNCMLPHNCPHTRFSRRFMTDPPQTVHVMRYMDLLEGLAWQP